MPNTYSQILIQIVFAVEGRQNLINENNRQELQRYITGILAKRGQKVLAIFCMPDHIHIVIGLTPTASLSDLVRDVKSGSSAFINRSGWIRGTFRWQEGFGAFSYSRSQLNDVVRYVNEQKDRHSKRSFKDEYHTMLRKFEIEYDEKYVFDFYE